MATRPSCRAWSCWLPIRRSDNPTVDLEYSADGGTSWQPLASGLTMDRFGRGSYTWAMPMSLIPGDNYRLRAKAGQGSRLKTSRTRPF